MPLKIQSWTVGPFATNCYLIVDEESRDAILFDAGMEPEVLVAGVRAAGVQLTQLINTHGHIDHVAGNRAVIDAFGVPLLIHADDAPMLKVARLQGRMFGVAADDSPDPDEFLNEGDALSLGPWRFEISHTPGHSPGSLSFYQPDHEFCIVGDTLFAGSVGRTDLPGGDWPTLAASIRQKLFALPDATTILPGHMGLSTIGHEKRTNPFVGKHA